jgi:hypothetical protein
LAEVLLGGVAGSAIGRLALTGDSFNTGFGYGVYLTNSRIIGLSYQGKFSRSNLPGYLVGLCFAILVIAVTVYIKLSGLSGNQQIPYGIVFIPLALGLAASTLILLFLRQTQTGNQIRDLAPKSLLDLEKESPDVVMEREDVVQVTVDQYRINILAKSGQWYAFMVSIAPRYYSDPTKWKGQPRELFDLFQKFCSFEPNIAFWVKQHGDWRILTGPTVVPSDTADVTRLERSTVDVPIKDLS